MKWNDWISRTGVVVSCQKLGTILENKGILKLMFYQKISITKSYFSIKKKFRKIPMIFVIENWLWKSNLGTFWHIPITPICKIQWFHLTKDDY